MSNFYEDLSWNFYTGTRLTLQEHCLEPAANAAEVNSVPSFCRDSLVLGPAVEFGASPESFCSRICTWTLAEHP